MENIGNFYYPIGRGKEKWIWSPKLENNIEFGGNIAIKNQTLYFLDMQIQNLFCRSLFQPNIL